MPAICYSLVRGRVMRATRVDECCRPVEGLCAQVTTDGFISVEYSPEIFEGSDIEQEKANGQLCISDKACDEIKWINVTMTVCRVDPDLFTLMTGYQTVVDFAGNAVGNRVSKTIDCDAGFSLEVWSDVTGVPCPATPGAKPYGYLLLPCVVGGIISDFTVENAAINFTFTGRTKVPSGWGTGPYNVVPINVGNTAGPLLTPIGTEDHLHLQYTTIAPPASVCGCQELVIP